VHTYTHGTCAVVHTNTAALTSAGDGHCGFVADACIIKRLSVGGEGTERSAAFAVQRERVFTAVRCRANRLKCCKLQVPHGRACAVGEGYRDAGVMWQSYIDKERHRGAVLAQDLVDLEQHPQTHRPHLPEETTIRSACYTAYSHTTQTATVKCCCFIPATGTKSQGH